jgi:hypothetical protein
MEVMVAFGLATPPSEYTPNRDWIEPPVRTGAGNLVLVVNREQDARIGSRKVAHVVLTPQEAAAFVGVVGRLLLTDWPPAPAADEPA